LCKRFVKQVKSRQLRKIRATAGDSVLAGAELEEFEIPRFTQCARGVAGVD
jgi:hypothetical protein